jgi:hypothetical protein
VIEDVARSLAAAIPDCTAEDIADILWLATTLPPAPDSAPAVPDSETAPAPEPVSDTPVPPPMETEQPQADEPEAMLAQGAGPVSGGQVVSATAVGLRAPAATNRALSTARVFSLFKRIQRPGPPEVDIDATVEATADARRLTVVTKPGRERGFDVALVTDTSPVMSAYGAVLAEFEAVLLRAGAFRSVSRWTLVTDVDAAIRDRAGVEHHPDRVIDPSGRRLVLLVTDATADHWYRPAIWQALRHWAEVMPVAIVHVLPAQYRAQGPLGGSAIAMRSRRPGGPNRTADVEVAWWDINDDAAGAVPLPVVELRPSALAEWAQTVATGTGWVDAVWARQPPGRGSREANAGLSAEDRVRAFQATASHGAQVLARILAGAPVLSWPLINVLQARLVPGTGASELAEVLVGGLLERVTAAADGTEDVRFRFRPSVSELLSRGTTATQEWDTFEAISDYLERNAGTGNAIHALLADPQGLAWVDAGLEPFAALGRSVAARLGLMSSSGVAAGEAKETTEDPGETTVPQNPFSYGSPISDPRRFFGRTREVEQIFSRLRNAAMGSTLVVGDRRIGKTSLLYYLRDPGVRSAYGLGPERYLFVYVSLLMLAEATGPYQLWRRLLSGVHAECPDREVAEMLEAAKRRERLSVLELDDLFRAIDSKGLHVVFLLDDFEGIAENENIVRDFYHSVRSMLTAHNMALVIFSYRKIDDLRQPAPGASSPLFNVFATINLSSFSDADVRLMVSRSLGGNPVQFSEREIEQIIDLAGLHPGFLQVACSILYESHHRSQEESARVALLAEEFRTQAIPFFAFCWDELADHEKITLIAAASLEQTAMPVREFPLGDLQLVFSGAGPAVTRLVDRGLLVSRDVRYRVFSSVFGPWILQQITAEPGEEQDYSQWLAENKGHAERIVGENGGPLRDILLKVSTDYRRLILAWASDPQTLPAMTGLLENVLPTRSSEVPRKSIPPVNPYIAGSPVTGTEMFYGREDVFSFIRRNLIGRHRDTPIVLYGPRRMGKTSVLYQLHRHLDPSYRCIFIDLHGLSLDGLGTLLHGVASSISRGLRRDHQLTVAVPDRASFLSDPRSAFETMFLDRVLSISGEGHLVVMLDEVARLQEEVTAGRLEREVYDYLRYLVQYDPRLNFIFSLGTGPQEMTKEYAFMFGVALYHRISFLEPEAARGLITEPVRNHYQVAAQAIERVLQVTSGHPYYTQLLCHCLFDLWSRSPESVLSEADVEAVLPEAIEPGSANLTYVWEDSTPGEQVLMAGLADAMGGRSGPVTLDRVREAGRRAGVTLPDPELSKAVRSLISREIITGDKAYSFAVDLQRLWIEQHRRLAWVKEESAETSQPRSRRWWRRSP